MTEAKEQVTIRFTSKPGKIGALHNETVRIFPVSRWILSLLLAPAFIALAFLCAFFFLVFFPLFVFSGVILSLWIGWQFWKPHKSNSPESLEGEYAVIKETVIIEVKTDEVGHQ